MTILTILTDISNALISIINDLKSLRKEHPEYKILIGPAAWCLTFAKVMIQRVEAGGSIAVNVQIPTAFRNTIRMLYGCAPNSILCFNKAGLFIFFADMYFVWFGLLVVLEKFMLSYVYVALKIVSTAMPFFWLTPTQRLPFWILGLGLVIVETPIALWLTYSWGYGIDWEGPESFYKNWGKHYRYRYATTNRQLTVELSAWAYVISKFLILCGVFCYSPSVVEVRNATPHVAVRGSLTPNLNYLNALIEQDSVANLRYGVLFLLAMSSLGVYSIILAGWSSNSKYAFIGALRSAAQMISYEVAISLIILPVVIFAGSLNLTAITHVQNITTWFLWPLLPISILFLIAMLAETNRTPFDLPEAEAELVAGYNVDYSSLPFAMFFLAEYCNMILISVTYCLLFLGGGLNGLHLPSAALLALKASFLWVFFVLVRATLPRYRYDQLMDIGWKVFLPVAGGFLIFNFGVLVYFDALPVTGELPVTTAGGERPFSPLPVRAPEPPHVAGKRAAVTVLLDTIIESRDDPDYITALLAVVDYTAPWNPPAAQIAFELLIIRSKGLMVIDDILYGIQY